MVTLAVLQPGYAPWLGYFDQMVRADIFLHYDTAQYDKNGWRNRNRILTTGGVSWLTVPVAARLGEAVRDVRISQESRWPRKHITSLSQAYARAPHRDDYLEAIEAIIGRKWERLIDLDIALIDAMADWLAIDCQRGFVSDYGVPGRRSEKLINLCKAVGADRYLSGDAAVDYLDVAAFARAGITVEWQRYKHPRYRQCRRLTKDPPEDQFVPFLSTLDLLLNCGAESGQILCQHADKKH